MANPLPLPVQCGPSPVDLGPNRSTEQGAVVEGTTGKAAELLATLYQSHYQHLLAHLRKLSNGRDSVQGVDLEDLVSQAFLGCYTYLPDNVPQAYVYLRTAVSRLYYAQAHRAKIVSFTHTLPDPPAPDSMEQVDTQDLLSRALAPLLDREREILIEWSQGTDLRELAQSRGVTIASAKALMFRARAKAKKALQRECNQ